MTDSRRCAKRGSASCRCGCGVSWLCVDRTARRRWTRGTTTSSSTRCLTRRVSHPLTCYSASHSAPAPTVTSYRQGLRRDWAIFQQLLFFDWRLFVLLITKLSLCWVLCILCISCVLCIMCILCILCAGKQLLSAFYLDPYARPAQKLGGAWVESGRGK